MAHDMDIPKTDRVKIAEGLNKLLADTYTLYLKTHNFHWNVRGPMFQTLHLMFETQYNELWLALDAIAERIRALGFSVPATNTQFGKLTSIKEAVGVPKATEMIQQLVEGHRITTEVARSVAPLAESVQDQATLDLLTQRLQTHEKTAWMLGALLEK